MCVCACWWVSCDTFDNIHTKDHLPLLVSVMLTWTCHQNWQAGALSYNSGLVFVFVVGVRAAALFHVSRHMITAARYRRHVSAVFNQGYSHAHIWGHTNINASSIFMYVCVCVWYISSVCVKIAWLLSSHFIHLTPSPRSTSTTTIATTTRITTNIYHSSLPLNGVICHSWEFLLSAIPFSIFISFVCFS